jgi:hypothetical protein
MMGMQERQCACGDWFDPNSWKQKSCNACRFKSKPHPALPIRPHIIRDNRDQRWQTSNAPQQWRVIPGFEDRYEISDHGDILSLVQGRKILRPTQRKHGYEVMLSDRYGKRQFYLVHRLLLMTFRPIALPEACIAEPKNEDKYDLHLDNWQWATRQGEHHNQARLVDDDVRMIRSRVLADSHLSYRALAEEYGVTSSAIHKIVNRMTWKHVS